MTGYSSCLECQVWSVCLSPVVTSRALYRHAMVTPSLSSCILYVCVISVPYTHDIVRVGLGDPPYFYVHMIFALNGLVASAIALLGTYVRYSLAVLLGD